ncbi:CRISPR-associated protein Cmr6 [Thermosipho melanesiensis]|uniref:CRISPR-associated RAMP protein, Cmr6 family n=2 Tax=Thermosipho melanesiensis TaxID=46541 RepID=A6LNK5_THEM4|nr:type III-B CRISPR module RAMP protein Cmr6 [Thermosipho melanesiensis]ABR31506.1 CRISPR-associated RAMP protein, Cmr6 family [Thermosipho melanesiensis BI429]APT74559.1 CRISPR-associated protein Cmr6 [Thermosipho melanesiensis]OOC35474.1 CRISPR-associated protein Cmr6 [Thermosipho melanesiensis]OOC36511.1 CRISPR-associated protein Cmr6 [Thermosipho melanesiensis]OOC36834.1 CRISPR-associated protein Cmr6 [Thermosipho melanesiensis]
MNYYKYDIEKLKDKNSFIKNASLYYNKFVFKELVVLNNKITSKSFKKSLKEIRERYKDVLISIIKNLFESSKSGSDSLQEIINSLRKIRENFINSLKQRYIILSYTLEVKTPFLIGAGIPSIDEIGFYWLRNYGIPVIPGTSIKGCFKSCLLDVLKDYLEEIFGTEDKMGKVIFLDAIPLGEICLGIDFQTPHFQKYYIDNKPPNDVYNPVPLSFLHVSKGRFRLDILIDKDEGNIADKIKNHIKIFLEEYGVGAKTSMGYGRFKIINQNS